MKVTINRSLIKDMIGIGEHRPVEAILTPILSRVNDHLMDRLDEPGELSASIEVVITDGPETSQEAPEDGQGEA